MNMNEKNEDCLTGECPEIIEDRSIDRIKLSEGSGGKEMHLLISKFSSDFYRSDKWKNLFDDSSSYDFGDKKLLFTTDSYIVTPIFFPGGNIGKIAFCGTVNDLAVLGAKPIGLSLSFVLEEGFSKKEFFEIVKTLSELSNKYKIPIVTGDTKVMEKGSVDKIIINTSGIGLADFILDKEIEVGDSVIVSGGLGEHGTALLAKRFELETDLETDSKPLHEEINEIKELIKQSKDITRGGLASILNELVGKNKVGFMIDEEKIPMKQEVRALCEILGIDVYSLACEGRFLCICSKNNEKEVVDILKRYNSLATCIGNVKIDEDVIAQTKFGKKMISMPSGNIVPRIC